MAEQTDQADVDICERISRLPAEIRNQILEECITPRLLEMSTIKWTMLGGGKRRGTMKILDPHQPSFLNSIFPSVQELRSPYGVSFTSAAATWRLTRKLIWFHPETDIVLSTPWAMRKRDQVESSEHVQNIAFLWHHLFNEEHSQWPQQVLEYRKVWPNLCTINFIFPEQILDDPSNCNLEESCSDKQTCAAIRPLPDSTKLAVNTPSYQNWRILESLLSSEEEMNTRIIKWEDARDRLYQHLASAARRSANPSVRLEFHAWILRREPREPK